MDEAQFIIILVKTVYCTLASKFWQTHFGHVCKKSYICFKLKKTKQVARKLSTFNVEPTIYKLMC